MADVAVHHRPAGAGRTRVVDARRDQPRDRWFAVAAFVAVAAVVWAAVAFGAQFLPRELLYPRPPSFAGGVVFEGWARWDAGWYRAIALDGYVYYPGVQSSVAFFPAYPLVLRLVSPLLPSVYITGTLVTACSGLAAAVLFHRWCQQRMTGAGARTAVLVLLLYPFAIYLYGPVYADAFCLALTLAAFVALERDRVWLAGVLGLVASAARPVGLLVAVALVLRLLELRNASRVDDGSPHERDGGGWRAAVASRWSPRAVTRRDLPILLSFGGFGGYCAYLWVRFGDPFLFETVQSAPGWGQGSGPHTWLKFQLAGELASKTDWPSIWLKVVQGALALGVLLLVPRISRRFGLTYAVLAAGVALMPMVATKDFMGTGRYLLLAFPAFAALGELLDERAAARRLVLVGSAIALVGLAALFGRGEYLA